jgi:flagellar motor switch protein FliN
MIGNFFRPHSNDPEKTSYHGSNDTCSKAITVAHVDGIKVDLTVLLGSVKMPIGRVLEISRGAVITLDCTKETPSRIYANGQLIAEGELTADSESMKIMVTNLAGDGAH